MKKFKDDPVHPTSIDERRSWRVEAREELSTPDLLSVVNDSELVHGWRVVCLSELVRRKHWTKNDVRVWLVKQRLDLEE